MTAILIISGVIWGLLTIISFYFFSGKGLNLSLREHFLLAALGLGLIVVSITEGLSLFTLLTATAIKIAWIGIFLCAAATVPILYFKRPTAFVEFSNRIQQRFQYLKSQPWQVHLILILIGITMISTLLTIRLNPVPTNGDSMRYHLTRTLVWEQQANLDHFPTHTIHQITLPPFAEYAILQVNAITGTDHFARLVQWMSMLTILVGISEIAKRMGGSLRHQLLASLLTISIPMVIAQSTSTMNDLVVAGFLIIFINFAFRFKDNPKNLFYVGATGIALGLAFLSKSTAFIFALPFSIWIAYRVIVKEGFGLSVFKVGGVIVMAALVINSGHFTRNINTFGSPLGNNLETVNEIFTTRSLSSNVIRNIQMHMPGVKGENPALINLIGAGARKITWNLHDLTGMDYEDPRTTYHNKYKGFASPGGFNTAEGRAGAFIHLCLIFFTGLFSKSKLKTRDQKQYLILLVTTFLFFSFILKAQTPINRLIMPLFVIWIPLISFTVYPSKKTYWYILPLMVWLCALPWLFNGKTRPLIRSEASAAAAWPSAGIEAYFVRKPSLHPIYDEITDFITETQCKEIGVVFLHNEFFYEYPFWMMLREKGFDGKIQHMLVENESKVHEDFSYSPCIIISNAEMNSFPEFSLTPYDQFLIYTKN